MNFNNTSRTIILMSFSALALASLSACSNHVAPTNDDIQHALAERGSNVTNVSITECQRHNGVDDGNDTHFDWYGCRFTATIDGMTKSGYNSFTSNGDGWHSTE